MHRYPQHIPGLHHQESYHVPMVKIWKIPSGWSIRRRITIVKYSESHPCEVMTYFLRRKSLSDPCPTAVEVKVLVAQSCPTLWDPRDYRPRGSSVHGILQARILEQVAIPFSRRTSWSRDQTQVSYDSGGFFTVWATREALFVSIDLPVLWDISCKWNFTSCGLLWLVSSSHLCSHSVLKIDTL